jgi:hypothetical protein
MPGWPGTLACRAVGAVRTVRAVRAVRAAASGRYRSRRHDGSPAIMIPALARPCGRTGWPRPPRMPRRSRRPPRRTRGTVAGDVHARGPAYGMPCMASPPSGTGGPHAGRHCHAGRTPRGRCRTGSGRCVTDEQRTAHGGCPRQPCCARPAHRERIKRTPSNDSQVARRIPPTRCLGYGMKSHMRYYGSGATARLAGGTQLRKRIADAGHF